MKPISHQLAPYGAALVFSGVMLFAVPSANATVSVISGPPSVNQYAFVAEVYRNPGNPSPTTGVLVGKSISLSPPGQNSTGFGGTDSPSASFIFKYTPGGGPQTLGISTTLPTSPTTYYGANDFSALLGTTKAAQLPSLRNFVIELDPGAGASLTISSLLLNGNELLDGPLTSSGHNSWLVTADWLAGGFELTGAYQFSGTPSEKSLFRVYAVTPEPATACFGGALVLGLGAMELRRRRNKA